MENNDGVYQQIIEVNNTAQAGNEFLSQHLVEEVVTQNVNDQGSTVNCEMSGIQILLPNDYIHVQEQGNSNILLSATDLIADVNQLENVILQQEPNNQGISQEISVEGTFSSCSQNLQEPKLDEFIIQNQTTYHQGNFDDSSSALVSKSESDNQPANDDALSNSQSVADNLSDIKDKSVKESEQIFSTETQAETLILSSQTESVLSTEMSDSNINELISEVVSDSAKESQDQSNNHVTKAEDKDESSPDSNDKNVNSNKDVHSSPLPESPEKVNCSEKVEKAVEVSANNSNVLQSDDVAVLAEFGPMNYELQMEEKMIAAAKVNDQVLQELKNMLDEKSKDVLAPVEKSEEATDKTESEETTKLATKNDVATYEDDELDLQLSADSSTDNHRKVLQDIFADWTDENGEEDAVQSSSSAPLSKDPQDLVEMELQNLLNEDVKEDAASTAPTENSVRSSPKSKTSEESSAASSLAKGKNVKVDKSPSKSPIKSSKPMSNAVAAKDVGQLPKNPSLNQSETKKQSPRPGVKVPGSHLTSQIASTAEVNEVLKERLKEKQKDLQNPKTADIVFVKKMTQRLSSQLLAAAAAGSPTPPSLPSQQQVESNDNEKGKSPTASESLPTPTEQSKSTTDSNELLAILEGDVDPDWSNLKPHSTADENNRSSESLSSSEGKSSSKLDPATERELALKQLLELPKASSTKKKANKKSGKAGKDDSKDEGDVIHLSSSGDDSPKQEIKAQKQQKENNSHNTRNSEAMELSVEESRSGRKRKLTEKAREHELNAKRQKVIKGKVTTESKDAEKDAEKEKSDTAASTSKSETPKLAQEQSPSPASKTDSKQKKTDAKQSLSSAKSLAGAKGKELPAKRSAVGLAKKDTTVAKRKLAVKNATKAKKSGAAAKAKSTSPSSSPTPSSSNKTTPEKAEKPASTSALPKEKKKVVSEIDRLLQDEGIVNMLYDAEQPDCRKRLIPITKSQKKVVDVEKAERELNFRAKIVKSAVLRLRHSSTSGSKVSPRSRRTTSSAATPAPAEHATAQQTEKKSVSESSKSSEPLDFVLPTKMRNAADASRIIRRHSSSSFSSTSASPRVSIDQPPESLNVEELEASAKNKRKLSNDSTDKTDVKKGKKKSLPKSEVEESEKSPVKKEPVRRVATRSNVSTSPSTPVTAKAASKNKKVAKGKAPAESSPVDVRSTSKTQDGLSACLAGAASALLSTSSTTRSSGAPATRKKGSTKSSEDENVDTKKFSNKEISVKYHGHLVQLILTPSVPVSGIRNSLTIQAMNEFEEALTILKKDSNCRVVLFTSTGTSFCEGLELSYLLHSNVEERKKLAKEMAVAIKDFLRCLSTFNKPIVAGVQGAAIGLGVTMLPLFDLVIASDGATFSTPFGKLGQIGEGTAVLTLSRSLCTSVTNELLLGGRVLTASDALRAGLVTRVLWPDKFQGELLPSMKSMSEQSASSMEATKAMLRRGIREHLDQFLESESYLLVQHWISTECQEAMKAFIEEKGQ